MMQYWGTYGLRKCLPLVLLMQSLIIGAQVLPPDDGPPDESDAIGGLVNRFIDTDSFKVQWVSPWLPLDTFELSDQSDMLYFHHYDPARRRDFDYIHLGMPGTALRPVLWTPVFRKGNAAGVEAFDPYRLQLHPTRIYLPEVAFSNLSFLRGSDQDDYFFEANAGLRLQNDILFSLDYQRLPQIGEYRGQRLRNTSAVFTLQKSWKEDKIISTIVYGATEMIHENNGGIVRDDIFQDPIFNVRANVPVFIENGQMNLVDRNFTLHHRVNLLKIGQLNAYGEHELRYDRHRFKAFDRVDGNALNSDFYQELTPFHDRGMRMAYRHSRTENHLRIGSNVARWTILQAIDWRIGYEFASVNWQAESENKRFNESYLHADATFRVGNILSGKAQYHAGFFDAANNTRLHLEGNIKWMNHFYAQAAFDRMRVLPSLLMQGLTINFQQVYSGTGFSDPRMNTLSFKIGSTRWKNYAGLALHRNLNWIYFSENLLPQQLNQSANLIQVYLFQPLKWRVLHWDQAISYQQSAEDALGAVPLFYKSSLYYEGNLLSKSSLLRVGADFRYMDTGSAWTYHPIIAQWVFLPDHAVDPFNEIDVFIAMKVKVFKAFFRFENLINAITGKVGFTHVRYPMQDAGIRLGIEWIFVN